MTETLIAPRSWGRFETALLRFRVSLTERFQAALDARLRRPAGWGSKPWQPVRARVRTRPGRRDARLYDAVIDQFEVEENPRYAPNRQGLQETYCNIFVWDVTRAMDAEVPHWVGDRGQIAAPGAGSELDANGVARWLECEGAKSGWRVVDAATARKSAEIGLPSIAAWFNPAGAGHVAIVRARPGDAGLTVAQAGSICAANIPVHDAFPTAWSAGRVIFYAHD